jgi:hypothetical protein
VISPGFNNCAIGPAKISPMARTFTILYALQVVVLAGSFVTAQDSSHTVASPNWKLTVEIRTDKGTYLPNEAIHYRAVLRNSGSTVIYVSKSFFEAGGGISGFYVSVKQLTGKRSGRGCSMAGDRFGTPDPRTPEQILREDFLRLTPGGIVGFESQYWGCAVRYPGIYEIDVTYSAEDLNIGKVRNLAGKTEEIVTGQIHSEPSKFRVRGR